jgi:hypothetical protein
VWSRLDSIQAAVFDAASFLYWMNITKQGQNAARKYSAFEGHKNYCFDL